MPIDQNKIPLYSPGDNIVGFFSANQLKAMKGVDLVVNRRGYVREARLKPLTCHTVRYSDFSSLYGTCPIEPNERIGDAYKIYQLRRLTV